MSSRRSVTGGTAIVPPNNCVLCFNTLSVSAGRNLSPSASAAMSKLLDSLGIGAEAVARGPYCRPCINLASGVELVCELLDENYGDRIGMNGSAKGKVQGSAVVRNGPIGKRSTNNSVAAALSEDTTSEEEQEEDDDDDDTESPTFAPTPRPRPSPKSKSSLSPNGILVKDYHTCPFCPNSDKMSRGVLSKHFKNDHPGNSLPSELNLTCPSGPACKYECFWKNNLKRHLQSHHPELGIDISTLDLEKLIKKNRDTKSKPTTTGVKKQRFKITIPLRVTGTPEVGPSPPPVPLQNRIFACAVCPKTFTNPEDLRVHRNGNHDTRRKKSPASTSTSSSNKAKKRRARSSGGPSRRRVKYQCRSCTTYFYNRAYLREHRSEAHPDSESSDEEESSPNKVTPPAPAPIRSPSPSASASVPVVAGCAVAKKSTALPPGARKLNNSKSSEDVSSILGLDPESPEPSDDMPKSKPEVSFDPNTNPYVCPCPKCTSSFDELLNLKFHISVHHSGYKLDLGAVPRRCEHCDSTVKNLEDYKLHLEEEHEN